MAFPNQAARNQYLKTQIETASKEQLVVMLFDGVLRFTEQARKAIEEKAIEASHNALMRSQAIVMELIVTVDKDKGGEVAKNLLALHTYAYNCLVQCNMKKETAKIDEVQNIYRNLRDGWLNAMDSLGVGPRKVAGSPAGQAPAAAQPAAGQRPVGQPAAPAPAAGRPLPTGRPLPVAGGAPVPPQQKPGLGGILAGNKAAAPMGQAPVSPLAGLTGKAPAAAAPAGMTAKPAAPIAPAAAAAPKAPAAPATPAPAPAAPVNPAAPAAAPRPAAPVGGSAYGMGRTAMMNAYTRPVAAAPVNPAAPAPAAPAPAAPAAQQVTRPAAPNQAAMLNAYNNGSRNIA